MSSEDDRIVLRLSTKRHHDNVYESDNEVRKKSAKEIITSSSESSRCENEYDLKAKLLLWAQKNIDTLKLNVITELLTILREEGHVTLPRTAQSLLASGHNNQEKNNQQEKTNQQDNNNQEKNNNPVRLINEVVDAKLQDFWKQVQTYCEDEIKKSHEKLKYEIDYLKRYILLDNNAENPDLSNTITMFHNNHLDPLSVLPKNEMLNNIDSMMPISDFDEFVKFDLRLKTEIEERKCLELYYMRVIATESDFKHCVYKMMAMTFTKSVQRYYSGSGRRVRGVGKEDFSATNVYQTIIDVLLTRFSVDDVSNAKKLVGKWLSGAGDREGGRRKRSRST